MADRLADWKSVGEHTFVDDPQHELVLEEFRSGEQQMLFVHLWVKKDWSHTLLKLIRREWNVLLKHVTCPIFACVKDDDEKWKHFISLFGFKPFTEAIWSDGSRRRIYWNQGISNVEFKTNHQFKLNHKLKLDDKPRRVPDAVSSSGVSGSDRRAEPSER